MRLTELADILDLDIELLRHANSGGNWSADFKPCVEVKTNKHSTILSSCTGYGPSPSEAMSSLQEKIEFKWLVIEAMRADRRREFGVPNLQTP